MTVIVLDIDGPLNPFYASDLKERGFLLVEEDYARWFIDVTHHGSWLRNLESKAILVWGSDWMDDSNVLTPYYMLDKEPDWIELQLNNDKTWKLTSVSEYLEKFYPNEPVIWLDDELEEDAFRWAEQRGRTLLIKADPSSGWVRTQYEEMLRFIRSN